MLISTRDILFCQQHLCTSGVIWLSCAILTQLWGNSEHSYRQPGCKVPQNEICRLTLPCRCCSDAGILCWINRYLVISLSGKLQRVELTAVGPRRRGPAGLGWSWERSAKLLLPPAAVRRARGSCHRPCGWGSRYTANRPQGASRKMKRLNPNMSFVRLMAAFLRSRSAGELWLALLTLALP